MLCHDSSGCQLPKESQPISASLSVVFNTRNDCAWWLQVERVERFVVVHGQILLNLIKLYPSKAIQSCAFASALKQKMQTRRHAKLYVLAKRQLTKAFNRNPMRVRPPALVWQGSHQNIASVLNDISLVQNSCAK